MAHPKKRRFKRKLKNSLSIPAKASQVLGIFFILFAALTLRVWQLCIIKHDSITREVLRPRQKIFIEQAKRGGIYDRFGKPLAVNKIQYQAGVFYAPIRQVPSIEWKRKGKKLRSKTYPRRVYIQKLAEQLGSILHQDPRRIEDLIHSKASILFDSPFILSDNVTEQQYYQLKMLENQWPGIYAGMTSKRVYPQGKVAGHLLGYMGAINRQEYESLVQEKRSLTQFLKSWELGYFPALPKGMEHLADVRVRLKELTERSYSIYDSVGKAGLEAYFDESLRGFHGNQIYYADAKGNFLRPLSSSQGSLSGKRLTLTISSELQQYAEELLIESEKIRKGRSIRIDPTNGSYVYQKQPWIKGGAIVVMDPNNGEVLALASCPRFDPNDFIMQGSSEEKQKKIYNVLKWLENEQFIGNVWDGKQQLTYESLSRRKGSVQEVGCDLTWEQYLNFVLPKDCALKTQMQKMQGLDQAIELQNAFEYLLSLSDQDNAWNLLKVLYTSDFHKPYPSAAIPRRAKEKIELNLQKHADIVKPTKRILDDYFKEISLDYDKLLLVDLCRLAVDARRFPNELLKYVQNVSIEEHRMYERAHCQLQEHLKKMCKELYRDLHFKQWREKHQKSFLRQKRREEKLAKQYPKPYLDYLDQEERAQFHQFWEDHKEAFTKVFLSGQILNPTEGTLIPYLNHFALWAEELKKGAHPLVPWRSSYEKIADLYQQWPEEIVVYYLRTLRSYQDLDRPLLGHYRGVFPQQKALEKDLARSFYPRHGYSYARSYAFAQATPQGSLFKLVTSYEALKQTLEKKPHFGSGPLDLFTFIDDLHLDKVNGKTWNVGFTDKGQPIPQVYKGGRLPRSHKRGIGKLNLTEAIAISSNPYFSLLASDILEDPEDLNRAARLFSYGEKTGLEIPGEIGGGLPKDLSFNKTGLYSYAIGHHTLVVTPVQSALMLSAIANGGVVFKPQLIQSLEGVSLKQPHQDLLSKQDFSFKEHLALLGIDYPFFIGSERGEIDQDENFGMYIKRQIDMPTPVQNALFKGMYQTVHSSLGTACPDRVRNYSSYHPVYQDYQNLKNQIIGKTSSAEVREIIDLDLKQGINTYKHVWFGAVSFEDSIQEDRWKTPELVVIVYLRYGDFGREAAPIAASLIKKWRELKKKYGEE